MKMSSITYKVKLLELGPGDPDYVTLRLLTRWLLLMSLPVLLLYLPS